jgi:hypothetical protein
MRKIVILLFCVIPFLCQAQTDILVLQKRGMHVRSYTVGDPIVFETTYGQWFQGTVDALRHDTLYSAGQGFHFNEIAALLRQKGKGADSRSSLGTTAMIAGAGFLAIGAVNGLLRKDNANQWYTTSGYIIGGALVVGGLLLVAARSKYYTLGGKYKLLYLQLNPNK